MSATDLGAINVVEKQSLTQFFLSPRGILLFSVISPVDTESALKQEDNTDSVSPSHLEYRKDLNRTITSLVLSKGRQEIIFATLDTFTCECFSFIRDNLENAPIIWVPAAWRLASGPGP